MASAWTCALESVRLSRATFAPARARVLAISEQSTPPAPVTTATLPERLVFNTFGFIVRLFLSRRKGKSRKLQPPLCCFKADIECMCSVQRHQFQPKVLPGASQRPRAAAQTKTVGIVGMNCCGKVSLSAQRQSQTPGAVEGKVLVPHYRARSDVCNKTGVRAGLPAARLLVDVGFNGTAAIADGVTFRPDIRRGQAATTGRRITSTCRQRPTVQPAACDLSLAKPTVRPAWQLFGTALAAGLLPRCLAVVKNIPVPAQLHKAAMVVAVGHHRVDVASKAKISVADQHTCITIRSEGSVGQCIGQLMALLGRVDHHIPPFDLAGTAGLIKGVVFKASACCCARPRQNGYRTTADGHHVGF